MPDQTETAQGTLRDFTITRVFDAPRELIWNALTDPEQLTHFFGPEGTRVPLESITVEPRQGGAFRLTMLIGDDETEHGMNATYKEFIEPERMVFETAGGITGTIELTDLGNGKTEFKWTTRAVLDDDFLTDAKAGTNSTIDQLEAHLAAIQT
ncbi:MAG TPA: SRPBCC domain-containing protein [Solirubrobacterales bacterium]|jgi:uncharacterized protein YndB with AHSA1/START domain|nr:SRPBCC domain-containing protein [Solirubrobacterales bacterium]